MSKGWTPFTSNDGELHTRFNVAPTGSKRVTRLERQIVQPGRDAIMEQIKTERAAADDGDLKDMSFGRYVGSIPMLDMLTIQKNHPDLFSPDVEIARKATIKFFNSTEGAPYRVKRA